MPLYNEVFTVDLASLDFLTNEAGELLNPRGEIFNSTKMQKSLASVGQKDPITVVKGAQGRYIVQDGATRVTAARLLGWVSIKACFPVGYYGDTPDPAQMVLDMLVHNVRKDIALSKQGKSFAYLIDSHFIGIELLAASLGEPVQYVQDCIALNRADHRIRQAVDSGQMKLTAFREYLQKRPEIQADIASSGDPALLTVRGLRKRSKEIRTALKVTTKVSRLEEVAASNAENELIAAFRSIVMKLTAAADSLTDTDKQELQLALLTLGEICE